MLAIFVVTLKLDLVVGQLMWHKLQARSHANEHREVNDLEDQVEYEVQQCRDDDGLVKEVVCHQIRHLYDKDEKVQYADRIDSLGVKSERDGLLNSTSQHHDSVPVDHETRYCEQGCAHREGCL